MLQALNILEWTRDNPGIKPGDPYQIEGSKNPFASLLERWTVIPAPDSLRRSGQQDQVPSVPDRDDTFRDSFYSGTTSIQAADEKGWVVSINS